MTRHLLIAKTIFKNCTGPNSFVLLPALNMSQYRDAMKYCVMVKSKKILPIISEVKKFHKNICGRHFALLIDHKQLLAMSGSRKDLPAYSRNRLQSLATILAVFKMKIKYRNTTGFGQADKLSQLMLITRH